MIVQWMMMSLDTVDFFFFLNCEAWGYLSFPCPPVFFCSVPLPSFLSFPMYLKDSSC